MDFIYKSAVKLPFYKIAMGNGYPDLLKKADEITDPPEENGIKNACIRHKWIKNF
ncbi:MAG: hypothetical protein U0L02_01025 [Kandleria vitulina]|uniref:hypothetical protein n=1 Tax=Kandleria vitulina TaxID=1630 RepID=UPI002E77BF0E|nr:hypothetical protein [Kandleria vitulina]MEE0987926.1 hypothetical protein [Kandleria vitulina]